MYAGVGLVCGSDADKEWQVTSLLHTTLERLGTDCAADLGHTE